MNDESRVDIHCCTFYVKVVALQGKRNERKKEEEKEKEKLRH
jgi:hypothetical protein